jgi:hypothetical protein
VSIDLVGALPTGTTLKQASRQKERKGERKMILKYRGYMKNWCYMEHPGFTVATLAFEKPECPETFDKESALRAASIQSHKIDGMICEEVGLSIGDRITYLIGDELFEPERGFTVVIPDDNSEAFVLTKEAYLMTDTGKTIERIA